MSCYKKNILFENGRSMIEMIGVLAVIGVLSASALAGYSKAMLKYRLNKQWQQITSILTSINTNQAVLDSINKSSYTYLTPILISTGSIPQEMIKGNERQYIYDSFKNQIGVAAFTSDKPYMYMFIYLKRENIESCANIHKLAQEGSDFINYIATTAGTYWGDNDCSPNKKCLKDITMENIISDCNKIQKATSSGPNITIYWY